MECACELERPPPHTHTHRHTKRERDRERERGTNKVCVWMRAIELKIVGERESRSPGEGEVAFYSSKTDINHVSI